jgi:CBS domain-containing protein
MVSGPQFLVSKISFGAMACSTFRSFSRSTSRRDRRGLSTVEYSVLLALLVGGILLSVDLVGEMSSGRFQSVSDHLAGEASPARVATNAPQHAESEGLVGREVQSAPSQVWRLGLTACLLIVLGVAFYRLHRGDHQQAEEPHSAAALEMGVPLPRFVAKRQEIMRTLAGDFSKLLMSDLLVRDLMTTDVTSTNVDMPVEELTELMKKLEVRHMIVTNDEKEVVGVVSDRDLSHRGKKIGDIMTRAPLTVCPDALMRPAMSQMLERHISSLPVVENGKLVGIITTTDLVMAFQCTMQVVQAAAADLLPRKATADA